MSQLKRFQIDLTEDELNSIDQLGMLAGLRTKREVVLNAMTLFRWAAKETMLGRTVCSIDEGTQRIRGLELPALTTISEKRPNELTEAEIRERLSGPMRSWPEFAPDSKGVLNAATVLGTEGGNGLGSSMATGSESL
jgi:hypothetical protein